MASELISTENQLEILRGTSAFNFDLFIVATKKGIELFASGFLEATINFNKDTKNLIGVTIVTDER